MSLNQIVVGLDCRGCAATCSGVVLDFLLRRYPRYAAAMIRATAGIIAADSPKASHQRDVQSVCLQL